VLFVTGQAYPNQGVSRETLDIYVRMLEDIPADLLWQAAERHMAQSNYFPRIAELHSQAARLAGTDSFDSLPPPDSLCAGRAGHARPGAGGRIFLRPDSASPGLAPCKIICYQWQKYKENGCIMAIEAYKGDLSITPWIAMP